MLKFFNRLCSVHLLIYSGDSFTGLICVCVCVCACVRVCVFITSRHTSFYFALLCNTSQKPPVFYKLKFCGNPMLSKPISIIFFFSNSVGSLCISVSHFGNAHNISNVFIIIRFFYGILCSVNFDVTTLAH